MDAAIATCGAIGGFDIGLLPTDAWPANANRLRQATGPGPSTNALEQRLLTHNSDRSVQKLEVQRPEHTDGIDAHVSNDRRTKTPLCPNNKKCKYRSEGSRDAYEEDQLGPRITLSMHHPEDNRTQQHANGEIPSPPNSTKEQAAEEQLLDDRCSDSNEKEKDHSGANRRT
jgi:hypothetical protein